jgi:hypothetical protein
VFADVEFHAGVKREQNQFAGRVAGESDAAGCGRDRDDERHSGEGALDAAG